MAQTIPQSHPISADQVRNNAGGFVFKVDDLTLLRRYIILGSDGELSAAAGQGQEAAVGAFACR